MDTNINTEHINVEIYYKVFFALLGLTVLTFLQPFIIGSNIHITVSLQMFIAILKTVLIVAYYMHLKYESKLFKMIVLIALVTLSIFFIITSTDAIFRNESYDLFR